MVSVRFICGTQSQHRDLEREIAEFSGTDDAILFPSCFDANGGIFEVLMGPEDAIISDTLNHASIIDGVRLSKAKRFRYANRNMADLRAQLETARAQTRAESSSSPTGCSPWMATTPRSRRSATSPTSSAPWSHGRRLPRGRLRRRARPRHPRALRVLTDDGNRVDILTGTLGKALGGGSGGYVAAHQEIIDLLASGRGPTCSPTRSPRASSPARAA